MRYLTLLLVAGLTCGISSCIKKTNTAYRLSGTLYWDCNRQPVANSDINLMHLSYPKKGTIASTLTDANGRFELSYSTNISSISWLAVTRPAGYGLQTIIGSTGETDL